MYLFVQLANMSDSLTYREKRKERGETERRRGKEENFNRVEDTFYVCWKKLGEEKKLQGSELLCCVHVHIRAFFMRTFVKANNATHRL